MAQLEASAAAQAAELEQLQQKARELDLELARNSQNRQSSSSLREDLNAERARVIAADKKVSANGYSQGTDKASLHKSVLNVEGWLLQAPLVKSLVANTSICTVVGYNNSILELKL